MKYLLIYIITLTTFFSFAQDKNDQKILALKKANDFVHEANELVKSEDYVSAEMEYRRAISEQPTHIAGTYNLGNAYYKKGNYEEALYRHQQVIKNAISKSEKHKAFHNIGNILMQNKKCKEAVEAFKNALRSNPTDDETRYNLGIAKECAEQQQDQQDKDDEKKDEEKKEDEKKDEEKKDKEEDKKDDEKEEGDKDEKEGEDKEDEEGKPKDDKKDKGEEGDKKNEQPKPKPGQLSPQQIKNLLEAMNNQEQKVQEKVNAEKTKGVKTNTEKDW